MSRQYSLFLLSLALTVAASLGQAGELLGTTVIYTHECCTATPVTGGTAATVGSADPLFGTNIVGSFNSIDVTDTQIIRVIDSEDAAASFNGDALGFPNVTIGSVAIAQYPGEAICGVRAETCGTFTSADVTFDAHDVYINWEGALWQSYAADGSTTTPLVLNVYVAPEPGTIGMGLTGGLLILAGAWKRRSRA